MIVSNIELYVILLKRDSLGTIIRLFPVVAWANRDDSLVAVIPTNIDSDEYKKAYPVDSLSVVDEYGYVHEYVLPSALDDNIKKWADWTIDGDRLFFVFGRDF